MKAIVCIKQVPNTTEVEVDEKTGVLMRDGVDSKINPYDLYAIETAVRLKERYDFDTTALSMGPPQAEAVIKEAYMMGVDEGVLLSDKNFAGADVLSTAYTISQGIQKIGRPDLVICGKQTTDGDTAQVGAELAEFLGVPHVTEIRKLTKIEHGFAFVIVELSDTTVELKVKMPCILVVNKGIYQPRLPSYILKKKTEDKKIKLLSLDDLEDKNEKNYGLNGSPTQVKRIFLPEINNDHIKITGESEYVSDKIFSVLKSGKFL